MKILFLTHWYPSVGDPGTGLFVREHAHAIAGAGVDVHVLHVRIRNGPLWPRIRVERFEEGRSTGTRIHLEGRLWKLIYVFYPWQLALLRKGLRKAGLRVADHDLVHSNVVHPTAVMGDALARRAGRPHVITEHWTRLEQYFTRDLLSGAGRRAYARAARLLPVSAYLGREIDRWSKGHAPITVVPNVVPGGDFHFRTRGPGGPLRVLMAARWNRTKLGHKRPDLVIDALEHVQGRSGRPILLQVVGDGDRIPELQARCATAGLSAEFLGHCGKPALGKLMAEADLFLHPSERETFSVVVAEALKCGTPVVASDVGAIPELITERNGVLVPNTVEHWAMAIEQALGRNYDRPAIAAEWVGRFSAEEVGDKVMQVYQEVLARH